MKKRQILIIVAIVVIGGLALLIRSIRTPKINTLGINPSSAPRQTTNLTENLKADNAISPQRVWQITGSKIIGYRRDNGEMIYSMDLPEQYVNGTAINSIDDTVLIKSNQDSTHYAVVIPAKNFLVALAQQTVGAVLSGSEQVISWQHNPNDTQTDQLVRENITSQNTETLATFARAYSTKMWLTTDNQLLLVPENNTGLANYDLLVFDLNQTKLTKTYRQLGYLFAVSPSGHDVYTTTYNFENNQIESYHLNLETNTKQKIERDLLAEPFATGTNDTVFLSAPSGNGGYDILSFNGDTVKVVSPSSLAYVSSIIVQSYNQLLVSTASGSQTIQLP